MQYFAFCTVNKYYITRTKLHSTELDYICLYAGYWGFAAAHEYIMNYFDSNSKVRSSFFNITENIITCYTSETRRKT
jgi:hypothetical protein